MLALLKRGRSRKNRTLYPKRSLRYEALETRELTPLVADWDSDGDDDPGAFYVHDSGQTLILGQSSSQVPTIRIVSHFDESMAIGTRSP